MTRFATTIIIGFAIVLAVSAVPAWAVDYSNYTNDELAAIRGTLRDASAEDRAAFAKEWQDRLQSMTVEERQNYAGRPANAPADGTGYRTNAPSGGYGMNQQSGRGGGGHDSGNGRGKGGGRGRK